MEAVGAAIRRFHCRLVEAMDAEGRPDGVLRGFALHLQEYLLAPSGRGDSCSRAGAWTLPGCFIYVPPRGVVWNCGLRIAECGVQSPACGVQSPASKVESRECGVQSRESGVRSPKS